MRLNSQQASEQELKTNAEIKTDAESSVRKVAINPLELICAHLKEFAIACIVLVVVVAGFAGFNVYLDGMFFREGTEHLGTTYSQVATTFELFANRNWSLLDNWESSLQYASEPSSASSVWDYYDSLKEAWHYSDFYIFNENDDFVTTSGRSGTAGSITNVFDEMYATDGQVATSYVASSGVRKIVFAQPLENPVVYQGVSYTGVAVSYDNEYVQGLVAGDVYSGNSDCYVVRENGDVVFSLEPKTVVTSYISNVVDFLDKNASFKRGTFTEFTEGISADGEGGALISYAGSNYYLIYQPMGIYNWNVVSIVKASTVDSTLNIVRLATSIALILLACVLFAGVAVIIVEKYRRIVAQEEQAHQEAEYKSKLTREALYGLADVADRFAIIDVHARTYRYHECLLDRDLYPPTGSYEVLLEGLNHRYTVLTDTDDAKLGRLLSIDALKRELTRTGDRIKVEYASRTEAIYMLMTVVPLAFDAEGELERVLLIGQDIGLRKELENEANTDALTGLFNKRYFNAVLTIKKRKKIPFTLFFLDLDRFKPVNDVHGHEVGDKLLKEVGGRLVDCVRTEDFAFRIGGDEFAIIATGDLDEAAVKRMENRICDSVAAPYLIDGKELRVGTSCGFASWPRDAARVSEVRVLADEHMYANKDAHHKADASAER